MLKIAAACVALLAFSGPALVTPAMAQTTVSQLVGVYTYDGTDTDGSKYDGGGTLVVKETPSGAVEIVWDDGDYVGIGQVVGDTLAVASVADGKNSIMLFKVNGDGTLTGKWWRRKDNGAKGTEVWKRK